jgi:hypothetical protein
MENTKESGLIDTPKAGVQVPPEDPEAAAHDPAGGDVAAEGFSRDLVALYKEIVDAGALLLTEAAVDAFVKSVQAKDMDLTESFMQAKDLSGGGQIAPCKLISIFTRYYPNLPLRSDREVSDHNKAVVDAIIKAEIMNPGLINEATAGPKSLSCVSMTVIDGKNVYLNMLEWSALCYGEKDPELAGSLAALVGAPVPEFHVGLTGRYDMTFETVDA